MLENGYIKIYRSLVTWEWYQDANTVRLFLHLLLSANYEPSKWRGIIVERGQHVSSYGVLARELKISVKNVRTALNHLISTGEVAHESTSQYGVFTVVNYDKFQTMADKTADNGHTNGTQAAHDGQQRKNNNKDKNDEKERNSDLQSQINALYESVWALYPNKKGKSAVSAKQKKILYGVGYETLKTCIDRYIAAKEDWRAYQNGSTFFNGGYVDYLDDNYSPNNGIMDNKQHVEIDKRRESREAWK